MENSERFTGAAMVGENNIVWKEALPKSLPPGRQVLCLGRGKRTNIYTDSQYAFATIRFHRGIYKERGVLTAEGKEILNKQEILDHLQAM